MVAAQKKKGHRWNWLDDAATHEKQGFTFPQVKPSLVFYETPASLYRKVPVVPGPIDFDKLTTTKLGTKRFQVPPDAEFDLNDPTMPPNVYNFLHDPHLKEYLNSPPVKKRLYQKGLITKDGYVKCTIKEFNDYRKWIRKLKLHAIDQDGYVKNSDKGITNKITNTEALQLTLQRQERAKMLYMQKQKNIEREREKYLKMWQIEELRIDRSRMREQRRKQKNEELLLKMKAEKEKEKENTDQKSRLKILLKSKADMQQREDRINEMHEQKLRQKEVKAKELWRRRQSFYQEKMAEDKQAKELAEEQRRTSIAKRKSVYRRERRKNDAYMEQQHKENRDNAIKHFEEATEYQNKIEAEKEKEIKKWRVKLKTVEERARLLEYYRDKNVEDSDNDTDHDSKDKDIILRRRNKNRNKSIWDVDNVLLKHIIDDLTEHGKNDLEQHGIIEQEGNEEFSENDSKILIQQVVVANEKESSVEKPPEDIGLTGHHHSFVTFGDIQADETVSVYFQEQPNPKYQSNTGNMINIPNLIIQHTKSVHEHLPVVDSNHDMLETVESSHEKVLKVTQVEDDSEHSLYEILLVPSHSSSMGVEVDSTVALKASSQMTLIHVIDQEPVLVSSVDLTPKDHQEIAIVAQKLVQDSLTKAALQLGYEEEEVLKQIGSTTPPTKKNKEKITSPRVVSEPIIQLSKKITEMSLVAAAVSLGYPRKEISEALGIPYEEQLNDIESMKSLNELYTDTISEMAVTAITQSAQQLGYSEDQSLITNSIDKLVKKKSSLSLLARGLAKTAILNASKKLSLECNSPSVSSLLSEMNARASPTTTNNVVVSSNYSIKSTSFTNAHKESHVIVTHNALRNAALNLGYSQEEVNTVIGKEKFYETDYNKLAVNLVETVMGSAIDIVSEESKEKEDVELQKELEAFALKFSMVVIGSAGKRLGYSDKSILKALTKDLNKSITDKHHERHPSAFNRFNEDNITETIRDAPCASDTCNADLNLNEADVNELSYKSGRRLTPYFPEPVQKKLLKQFMEKKSGQSFDTLLEEDDTEGEGNTDGHKRNENNWSVDFIRKIESITGTPPVESEHQNDAIEFQLSEYPTESEFLTLANQQQTNNLRDLTGQQELAPGILESEHQNDAIELQLSEYPTESEFLTLANQQQSNNLRDLTGQQELAPGILELYTSIQTDILELLSRTNLPLTQPDSSVPSNSSLSNLQLATNLSIRSRSMLGLSQQQISASQHQIDSNNLLENLASSRISQKDSKKNSETKSDQQEIEQNTFLPVAYPESQVNLISSKDGSLKSIRSSTQQKISNTVVDLPNLPRSPFCSRLSVNPIPSISEMKTPSLPKLPAEKSGSIKKESGKVQITSSKDSAPFSTFIDKDDAMQNDEPEVVLRSPADFNQSLYKLDLANSKTSNAVLEKGESVVTENSETEKKHESRQIEKESSKSLWSNRKSKESNIASDSSSSHARPVTPNYAKPLRRSVDNLSKNTMMKSVHSSQRKPSENEVQAIFERLSSVHKKTISSSSKDISLPKNKVSSSDLSKSCPRKNSIATKSSLQQQSHESFSKILNTVSEPSVPLEKANNDSTAKSTEEFSNISIQSTNSSRLRQKIISHSNSDSKKKLSCSKSLTKKMSSKKSIKSEKSSSSIGKQTDSVAIIKSSTSIKKKRKSKSKTSSSKSLTKSSVLKEDVNNKKSSNEIMSNLSQDVGLDNSAKIKSANDLTITEIREDFETDIAKQNDVPALDGSEIMRTNIATIEENTIFEVDDVNLLEENQLDKIVEEIAEVDAQIQQDKTNVSNNDLATKNMHEDPEDRPIKQIEEYDNSLLSKRKLSKPKVSSFTKIQELVNKPDTSTSVSLSNAEVTTKEEYKDRNAVVSSENTTSDQSKSEIQPTVSGIKFVSNSIFSQKAVLASHSAKSILNTHSSRSINKSKSVGSSRPTNARYRNYSHSTFRETIPSVFDVDYGQQVTKIPSINDVIHRRSSSKGKSSIWVPSDSVAKKTSTTGENLHSPSAVLVKSPSKQVSSSSFKSDPIFVTPAASVTFNVGTASTVVSTDNNPDTGPSGTARESFEKTILGEKSISK